jgi:transcriptional regulator with XRE-family HTH domain
MTLAQRLKKARTRKKMSMTQVSLYSEMAGDPRGKITQGYISRLESGKETNPSFHKIKTLCGIYGINPGRLF